LSLTVMVKVRGTSAEFPLPSVAVQVTTFAPFDNCLLARDPVPLRVVAPDTAYDKVVPPEQLSVTSGSSTDPLTT